MMYAPHKLYKRVTVNVRNKYNEIVSSSEQWMYMGVCRCDDNTTQHFDTDNGGVYTPKYHIVCPRLEIQEGDYVKAEALDGTLRGEGKVYNAPKCNYLDYMSVYV